MPSLALVREKFSDPVLAYGSFITVVINFAILAFAIFIMIKAMNTAKKRFEREQEAAPPPAPPADVVLLGEIRDLLKAKS
jgi:large conductance mechanosensitive channel